MIFTYDPIKITNSNFDHVINTALVARVLDSAQSQVTCIQELLFEGEGCVATKRIILIKFQLLGKKKMSTPRAQLSSIMLLAFSSYLCTALKYLSNVLAALKMATLVLVLFIVIYVHQHSNTYTINRER
jgi:hypothetical protein